ncbi:transcription repressor OFP6 [Mercurialis annua]|uniref:transcription repressor OFP6 n=1 Tax=Mercurialis annua TaxID=3986 RepID=UPI00216103DB|nr:transcription repressor OFP6 [Mercurialis annua]
MSSSNKKKLILNTVSINLGCNSCKKPNLSNIFNPKPKPKHKTKTTTTYHNHHLYHSCSTSSNTTATSATSLSPATDTPPHKRSTVRGLGRVGGESVAVEKDSDDPYLDFRHSMLQMILEKEIYSKDDLKELLNCFLQLNSPYYHGIIVRAFTEIWNGVFSVKTSSFKGTGGSCSSSPSCSQLQSKQHYNHQKLHYYYG